MPLAEIINVVIINVNSNYLEIFTFLCLTCSVSETAQTVINIQL